MPLYLTRFYNVCVALLWHYVSLTWYISSIPLQLLFQFRPNDVDVEVDGRLHRLRLALHRLLHALPRPLRLRREAQVLAQNCRGKFIDIN